MTTPKQVFSGIRILDFTQWLAGPQATRLMVDLGAEILKVELAPRGEHSRNIRIVPKDGKNGSRRFPASPRDSASITNSYLKSCADTLTRRLKHCGRRMS